MKKPNLSFWQIWNLSFGFLGVQIGYSLQNGNTSRILEALGANVDKINYFCEALCSLKTTAHNAAVKIN